MAVRLLLLWPLGAFLLGAVAAPAAALAAPPATGPPAARPPAADPPAAAGAPSPAPSTASSAQVQRVYCLARERWPRLVDALVALGLAARPTPAPSAPSGPGPSGPAPRPSPPADQIIADGGPVDLVRWSDRHPREFARACDAVRGAATLTARRENGDGPVAATAKVLLPLVAGALLTMAATEWRAAVDRGRLQGHALRELLTGYLTTAAAVLAPVRGGGVPGERLTAPAVAAATALGAHLGELGARHPWWRRVPRLRAALADDGAHVLRLTTDWAAYQGEQRAADRRARIGEVEDDLERIRTDLTAVARALGHPWRPHPLLWLRAGRAP